MILRSIAVQYQVLQSLLMFNVYLLFNQHLAVDRNTISYICYLGAAKYLYVSLHDKNWKFIKCYRYF